MVTYRASKRSGGEWSLLPIFWTGNILPHSAFLKLLATSKRLPISSAMNKQKQHENEVAENDLVSYLEEKMGHLKPYWSQIALGVCIGVLALIGGAYLLQQSQAMEGLKWQDLHVAVLNYKNNMDNTSLELVADQYPDDIAGLWALLYAADAEVRAGLYDFLSDRKAGRDKITKAQKYYQRILDSSADKSTMMIQRATYGLAYANESNGEFDKATELYKQLAELEDNAFAKPAQRALQRCENPEMKELYENFVSYIPPATEDAPGVNLPQRPDITFPEPGELQPSSGGEFEAGSTTSETETEAEESRK